MAGPLFSTGIRVSSTGTLATSQEQGRYLKVNVAAEGKLATGVAFPGPSCPLSEADGCRSPGAVAAAGTAFTARCLPAQPKEAPGAREGETK